MLAAVALLSEAVPPQRPQAVLPYLSRRESRREPRRDRAPKLAAVAEHRQPEDRPSLANEFALLDAELERVSRRRTELCASAAATRANQSAAAANASADAAFRLCSEHREDAGRPDSARLAADLPDAVGLAVPPLHQNGSVQMLQNATRLQAEPAGKPASKPPEHPAPAKKPAPAKGPASTEPSPSAHQQQQQQQQQGEEGEEGGGTHSLKDMQVTLVIAVVLVLVTMFFELVKEYIEEEVPHMMQAVVAALFGELTVLGFIALYAYFMLQTGLLPHLSSKLYDGDEEHLVELFENVHFALFFVMLVFVAQTVILVKALTSSIKTWHELSRLQRQDHWPAACAELRKAFAARAGKEYPGLPAMTATRRILTRPYWNWKIHQMKGEIRFALLRERFVAPPARSDHLPPLFNFAAYLRRRSATMTVQVLKIPLWTWVTVGFFLVLIVEVAVALESIGGREADGVEGYGLDVLCWVQLLWFFFLWRRMDWILDQCTPPHPLVTQPDGGLDELGKASKDLLKDQPARRSSVPSFDKEASVEESLSTQQRGNLSSKHIMFARPDRKWIEKPVPYEAREQPPDRSKMENLFPFGARGPDFFVFGLRLLLFFTAILLTIVVQWLLEKSDSRTHVMRACFALVPLLTLLFFAPRTLLPLLVTISSIEQLKYPGDIKDTVMQPVEPAVPAIAPRLTPSPPGGHHWSGAALHAPDGATVPLGVLWVAVAQSDVDARNTQVVEMKVEQTMRLLRTLTIVYGEATRAMRGAALPSPSAGGEEKDRKSLHARLASAKKMSPSFAQAGRKEGEKLKSVVETKEAVSKLKKDDIQELRSAFDLFDVDKSGSITPDELGRLLRILGIRVTPAAEERMFFEMDVTGDGKIEFFEFVGYMVVNGFSINENAAPDQVVDQIFDILDADGSGQISAQELRDVLHQLQSDLSGAELDSAMHMFDLDGSGFIQKGEFLKAVEMMNTFVNAELDSSLAGNLRERKKRMDLRRLASGHGSTSSIGSKSYGSLRDFGRIPSSTALSEALFGKSPRKRRGTSSEPEPGPPPTEELEKESEKES